MDALEQTMQELDVYRMGVEMQSRALQEAQAEIEYAMRRYADLYDHLPVGYASVSASGEILEANPTAAAWLGVERTMLRGRSIRRFLNPFDAGRFAAHLEECISSRSEKIFETTLRAETGAMLPVQFTSRVDPVTRDGAIQILVAITNVAQLKQTQQAISEIKREHDVLGDSISHDLRSPVVTIGMYARIILGDHGASLTPEVKAMVERIDRAAHRMEGTLRQLLAYSALVHEEVLIEEVKLNELVPVILREFQGQIETSRAVVDVTPVLPPVRACVRLLTPALSNLISNALKFTLPDTPPRVSVSAEQRGEFVVLKIADRGIGIEPAHYERIFRVFDRLHGYSAYPGAGIGLAIVRRAVERMPGRAWVESEKGQGSCFHLMLPKA